MSDKIMADKLLWSRLEDVARAAGLTVRTDPTRPFLDRLFAFEVVPAISLLALIVDPDSQPRFNGSDLSATVVSDILGTINLRFQNRDYVDALLIHEGQFVSSFVESLQVFQSEHLVAWLFCEMTNIYESVLNSRPECDVQSLIEAIRPVRQFRMN